jgi:hypothetical protein
LIPEFKANQVGFRVVDNKDHTKKSDGADKSTRNESSLTDGDAIITPLKIPIKDKKTVSPTFTQNDSIKRFSVIAGLLILIMGGLWLFSYLSKNPVPTPPSLGKKIAAEPKPTTISLTTTAPIPEEEETKTEQGEQGKEEAEEQLAGFLQLKKELDSKGVPEWGGELYQRALQLSASADDFFIKKEFISATKDYTEALAALNALKDGIDGTLQRFLKDGLLAINEGDGKRAQQLLSIALMIDPQNEIARHNLERAKNTEAVMQLIVSGEEHEQSNNLSLAHADYQEAAKLDPESEKAQLALTRVKNRIADEQFQQLMSSGFKALDENNYNRARTRFLKAQSFKPDSRQVNDALLQVDTAIRLSRIEELRKQATEAERSEDWGQALSSYQAVLALDESIRFALKGKERSLNRKQLEERINFYLKKPRVLESDQSLEKAISLLEEAKGVEPQGPRFTRQLQQLQKVVALAQTPVTVTIASDSMTEVAIYKVGRLGRFTTRELTLRPGTYTVVGARDGFKDVRQKLSVKAGEGPIHISVTCNDKI